MFGAFSSTSPPKIHFIDGGGRGFIVSFGMGGLGGGEKRDRIRETLCYAPFSLPNNSIIIMIRIMMMSLKRRTGEEQKKGEKKQKTSWSTFCACRAGAGSEWIQVEHNFSILQLSSLFLLLSVLFTLTRHPPGVDRPLRRAYIHRLSHNAVMLFNNRNVLSLAVSSWPLLWRMLKRRNRVKISPNWRHRATTSSRTSAWLFMVS